MKKEFEYFETLEKFFGDYNLMLAALKFIIDFIINFIIYNFIFK